ncbi:hypothetical protein PF008_g10798 [Phytophthora fragariae]|uniref:Uncharacterized protein n=1 Tax=Phytophthora fragariae TaxID=53985 RepID=A0A6G0RU60_9STRA|nr:hypothetical protein PF008_g10798 [Phytophthora fragariae]
MHLYGVTHALAKCSWLSSHFAFKTISARQKLGEDWANDGANQTADVESTYAPVDEKLFDDNNIVHLPYYPGDLHISSHVDAIADNALFSLLDIPERLDHNMTLHLVGYDNTKALSALVADVREVEEKNILYTVLGDSNVDMLPSEYTASKLVSYYGTSNLNLNLTFKLWDQCDDNEVTVAELLSYMIEATTSSRCIVYSYRT